MVCAALAAVVCENIHNGDMVNWAKLFNCAMEDLIGNVYFYMGWHSVDMEGLQGK